MKLKVLVVDDTVLYRTVITKALEDLPQVEVVGKAGNGKTALMRIKTLQPDLVTLDVEMPEMDGLQVLETIRREELDCGVLMISALTKQGGEATVKALELGAFDFITKPDGTGTMAENQEALREALRPLVEGYRRKLETTGTEISPSAALKLNRQKPPTPVKGPAGAPSAPLSPGKKGKPVLGSQDVVERMNRLISRQAPRCIAIGVSTGGPVALGEVIPRLPSGLGLPVFVVQHMPPYFTQSLAKSLNGRSLLTVKEAEDGETPQADSVYIAPGGYQMKVEASPPGGVVIRITEDPPENNCKPAVDYLFRSLAHILPGQVTAVIMTGMGRDGTMGARLLKRRGGLIIAQDEATSTVYGMPMEVVKAGAADIVLPLGEIAAALVKSVKP